MPDSPVAAPGAPSSVPAPVARTATTPKPATPQPPPNGATGPETPVEQHFELKVDGEVRKLTRAQLERFASKGAFADKLMRQAKEALLATQKKAAEQAAADALWDDDARLEAELEKRGKLDAIARRRLEKKVEEARLTPEQREAYEAKTRATELEGKLKSIEEQQQARARDERYRQVSQQTENELMAAADRLKFDRSPESFHALHGVLQEWVEIGLLGEEPMTAWQAEQALQLAQEKLDGGRNDLRSRIIAAQDGAALYELLGKEACAKLNRYQLDLARGTATKPPAPAVTTATQPPAQASKYLTPEEARAKLRMIGR